MVGGQLSGWLFFRIPNVKPGGSVAFCGDVPADKKLHEFMIVMVNSEEVQHGSDLTQWLTAKTLGVQSTCFSTTKMVVAGENFLGFRVMGEGVMMKITHVLWEAGAS